MKPGDAVVVVSVDIAKPIRRQVGIPSSEGRSSRRHHAVQIRCHRFDDVAGNSAATWRAVRDVLHRDHLTTDHLYSESQCRTLCGFSHVLHRQVGTQSRNLTTAAAGTPTRRYPSFRPLLPTRYARYTDDERRRVSNRHFA